MRDGASAVKHQTVRSSYRQPSPTLTFCLFSITANAFADGTPKVREGGEEEDEEAEEMPAR